MASSEIFILEYFGKLLQDIKDKNQLVLMTPSKVDIAFNPRQSFLNLSSISNCLVTPPIEFIPAIDNFVYEDFLCVSSNQAAAANFSTYGQFVMQFINDKIKQRQNLGNAGIKSINKFGNLSILDKFRARKNQEAQTTASLLKTPEFLIKK